MSLKHAILGFLSFSPFSGYDLKKAFDHVRQHPASPVAEFIAATKQHLPARCPGHRSDRRRWRHRGSY